MKRCRIAIVGCGAIGTGVARFIVNGLKREAVLSAICDVDRRKTAALKATIGRSPRSLTLEKAARAADLIVESACAAAAADLIKFAIRYKKDVMILSVGALVKDRSLLDKARRAGIRLYIPSGAICGVDGIGALSMGNVQKIVLTTSKPPKGLAGAEYLVKNRIDLTALDSARVVFRGGVDAAIRHFPKNINVAATLLLASNGKKIEVSIVADPRIRRNIHRIKVIAKEAIVTLEIENIPSETNPKTSTLTILSAQYALKKIFSSVKIGN